MSEDDVSAKMEEEPELDKEEEIEEGQLISFENLVFNSIEHTLPIESFVESWKSILNETMEDLTKSLECCEHIIHHFPHSREDKSVQWTELIKMVVKILLNNSAEKKALDLLCLLKTTFTMSSKASSYWKIHHWCMKTLKYSPPEYIELSISDYEQQFSREYIGIELDYEKFKSWAKENNITKEDYNRVQAMYLNLEEDKDFINEIDDNLLSWVEKVTGARCFPRCEEAVNDRKDLASSYLPYLRALNTSLVMEDRETSSVIFYNLVKRGLRDIVNVNDGLLELFTELSLNLAAQFLPGDQVKEVITLVEKMFNQESWVMFLASQRAILAIMYESVRKDLLNPEALWQKLETMVAEMKGNQMIADFTEVVLQCAVYEQKLKAVTNEEIIEQMRTLLKDNNDPNKHFLIVEYTRTRGSSVEALKSTYLESLSCTEKQLKEGGKLEQAARVGHVTLLRHYQQYLYNHGSLPEQSEITFKLAKCLMDYKVWHGEGYWIPPSVFYSGPYQLISSQQQQPLNVQSDMINNEVADLLQDVQMDVTEETSQDLRVFISNLDYKVNQFEIKAAFQAFAIDVVHVQMKTDGEGRNVGFGTIRVKTLAQQNLALGLNRIMIGTREAYISPYEEKKKKELEPTKRKTPKPVRPTLLVISAPVDDTTAPPEWCSEENINELLAPYGHIKSVQRYTTISTTGGGDKATAKIEFYMPEDAENAYNYAKSKEIFKDIPVTMRLSFVKAVATKSKPRPRAETSSPSTSVVDHSQAATTSSSSFLPEGQTRAPLAKERKLNLLVPRQARQATTRKQKLDISAAAGKDGSPEESPMEEGEPAPKRMNNEDFRQLMNPKK